MLVDEDKGGEMDVSAARCEVKSHSIFTTHPFVFLRGVGVFPAEIGRAHV